MTIKPQACCQLRRCERVSLYRSVKTLQSSGQRKRARAYYCHPKPGNSMRLDQDFRDQHRTPGCRKQINAIDCLPPVTLPPQNNEGTERERNGDRHLPQRSPLEEDHDHGRQPRAQTKCTHDIRSRGIGTLMADIDTRCVAQCVPAAEYPAELLGYETIVGQK